VKRKPALKHKTEERKEEEEKVEEKQTHHVKL
jgi:hypothetical protein